MQINGEHWDGLRVKGAIEYGIIVARAHYYEQLFSGDRFDGYPNFDHYRGEEVALRDLASRMNLEVLDWDKARISGVLTLEHWIAERGEQQSEEMVEFFEMVREGREDEWEV